jgi:dipeptidyl aminopeptidase/acylaminoacyl peptidase
MSKWTALPEGTGTVLAVSDELCAAAEAGRLRLWHGLSGPVVAQVPSANPARPQVLSDRVLWGPYAIGIDGSVTELTWAAVPGDYRQTAHAWSPDGRRAVAAARRIDPAGNGPENAVWLMSASSSLLLWEGSGVPPTAVGFTGPTVVVGAGAPELIDDLGHPIGRLDGRTPATRLDTQSGRLLVVESGQLTVWDGARSLAARSGFWLDACLTPDGEEILAVTGDGTLVRLAVASGLPHVESIPANAPITAIATDGQSVLASFNGLPALQIRA